MSGTEEISWFFEEVTLEAQSASELSTQQQISVEELELEKVSELFEYTELQHSFQHPPEGTYGLIIPNTYLTIKIPRFLRGFAQTVICSYWMGTSSAASLEIIAGGGFATLDGLERLKSSFYTLDEAKGEYCTYQACLEAASASFISSGKPVQKDEIWETHTNIQRNCPVSSCVHHDEGCKISFDRLDMIFEKLQKKELIDIEEETISVLW